MKRAILIAFAGLALLASFGAYFFPAIRAPFFPSPQDIAELIPPTGETATSTPPDFPLHLPPGFSISLFAKDLSGARVMARDPSSENLWVSQTSEGLVTRLEIQHGLVARRDVIFRNLRKPHGLAFDPANPGILYIAEEHRIFRTKTSGDAPQETILELPSDGGHFTRTLGFSPDGKLYVSVGSSCNVCNERDERRAAILRVDTETKHYEVYARGLRNAVFFTWEKGLLWATEMGRDWLGNNTPPDEINIVEGGKNYGWPNCYGKNIHDTDFDTKTYIRNPCMEPFERPAVIEIPAHSAPLGLAFVPDEFEPGGQAWPESYRGDLLVAYHGSWNRSTPTGYKVVRHDLRGEFQIYVGTEDFITGWLVPGDEGRGPDSALGRPVALLFLPDGSFLLSDDKAGVIYRITPPGVR